jgi:predicted PurR-regulated permease PerM
MNPETISSPRRDAFARRLVTTVLVVLAILLVWYTLHIFLLLFLGVIFGTFLYKTGAWIAGRTRIGVHWATAITVGGLIGISLAALAFMAPQISEQTEQLLDQLPGSWQQVETALGRTHLGDWAMRHMPSFEQVAGSIGGLMHRATAWIYSAVGALAGVLIIMVLGLYLAFNVDLYTDGIRRLVPPPHRPLAMQTVHSLGETLYWWLLGRLLAMLIIAVLSVVGLMLLGVPLALTLGVFAAVMAFVPNVGPLIGLIPALLVSVQESWQLAAGVLALYAGIQFVESYLITPMIQRQAIAMPAALILTAQLIMGSLQGAIGLLVATPLVACIMVLIKRLYIEAVLNDPD